MIARSVLTLLLLVQVAWADSASDWRITRMQAVENPNGIGFGFWGNYGLLSEVTEHFGLRPVDRVGFTSWSSIEPSEGVYDFSTCLNNDVRSHRCGSTTIGCINLGSSPDVSPPANTKLWIPDFYTPRIDDPETRAAAEAALYAYVTNRLQVVGRTILLIDYEIQWNYLVTTPAGQQLYSEWFTYAAATARQAAADIGMSDLLEIGLNMNAGLGNIGADTNLTWAHTIADVADVFTVDTYPFDEDDPTSPETTLAILEYWIQNYSHGKPVIVAENGYQSVLTDDPDYEGDSSKAYGTEAQQAEYFENLFQALEAENVPGGRLNGQLRGFCIWSYMDQEKDGEKDWYGMVREDGTEKPAADVVRSNFYRMAGQSGTAPSLETAGTVFPGALLTNRTELVYDSGTEHAFLRAGGLIPRYARDVTVHVELEREGSLVAGVNATGWVQHAECSATEFDVDATKWITGGRTNQIDLFFTGDFYPFTQTVSRLSVTYRDDFSEALTADTGMVPLFDFDRDDESFSAVNILNGAEVSQLRWKAAPESSLGLNGVLAAQCFLAETNSSKFMLVRNLSGLDVSGTSRLIARVRAESAGRSLRARLLAKDSGGIHYGSSVYLSSPANGWVELELPVSSLTYSSSLSLIGIQWLSDDEYDGELYIDLIAGDFTGADDNSLPNPPELPGDFAAVGQADGTVQLSWSDADETAYHEIQRSTDGNDWVTAEVFRTEPGIFSYVDDSAEPGVAYVYRLCAFNSGGRSPYSSLSVSPPVSLVEFNATSYAAKSGSGTGPEGEHAVAAITASNTVVSVLYKGSSTPGFSTATAGGSLFWPVAGTPSTESESIADADYFVFSIDADSGYALNLSSISFEFGGSDVGSAGAYGVTAYIQMDTGDGFATMGSQTLTIAEGAANTNVEQGELTVDLSGSAGQDLSGPVAFRIGAFDTVQTGIRYIRAQNITLLGSLTLQPPESSLWWNNGSLSVRAGNLAAGQAYTVQGTTNLVSGTWSNLYEWTGASQTNFDLGTPEAPAQFFRVRSSD